jgi:uncharacterized metal-binding protein
MKIIMSDKNTKPIIYSCSGCSNLASIAHDIALEMDRDGIAEMSCVSGVIGNVPSVKALAESGRPIIAIDGCSLACTKACLDACNIVPDHHFELSTYGIEKHDKWQESLSEYSLAVNRVYQTLNKYGYLQAVNNLKNNS